MAIKIKEAPEKPARTIEIVLDEWLDNNNNHFPNINKLDLGELVMEMDGINSAICSDRWCDSCPLYTITDCPCFLGDHYAEGVHKDEIKAYCKKYLKLYNEILSKKTFELI